MRRLVAACSIMLCLGAGCRTSGAPVMVMGTVVALGGVVMMADAQSNQSNSCEGQSECWPSIDIQGPVGVLVLLTGAAITVAGAAVGAVQQQREHTLAEQRAAEELRPIPVRVVEPPPPPRLDPDDPRRTGVWREVPPVYGDDGD